MKSTHRIQSSNRTDLFESSSQITNRKKILCLNILAHKKCKYGDHCNYAHSLQEQNMTPYNKRAYDIITGTSSLSNLNLSKDIKLYKCLLKLTIECPDCVNLNCPGGYNCKNGAIDTKHVICLNDLKWGTCGNVMCQKIHLTKRGFVPFSVQRKVSRETTLDNSHDKSSTLPVKLYGKTNLHGILLTEQTIKAMINNEPVSTPSFTLDSQEEKIKNYIHDEMADESVKQNVSIDLSYLTGGSYDPHES